jgi:hypothetical protein
MNPIHTTPYYYNHRFFLRGGRWWRAKMWVLVLSFYSISDTTEPKNEADYYFKIRLVPPREHAASPCTGR